MSVIEMQEKYLMKASLTKSEKILRIQTAVCQNVKESKRMVDEKTRSLETGLFLDQKLCQTFQEKYTPFGLELSMPEDLRGFCGTLEGHFHYMACDNNLSKIFAMIIITL